MAIKLTDKIHTVAAGVDTVNRGSAQANAGREAYTLQDVSDLIGGGGTIGGSITSGQIAFGASTADSIEGNANITTNGTNLLISDFIVHTGDTNTYFGFNSTENFQVQTNGNVQIQVNENHVGLFHKTDGEKIRTKNNGVLVTGQMDLAALNTAPATSTSAGTLGEIRWTTTAIYLCISTDLWMKADLGTF